jgi:putative SOS response-associated peptidase YedK
LHLFEKTQPCAGFFYGLARWGQKTQTLQMCGRFALTLPMDAMASLFSATQVRSVFEAPRYNIAPTQMIPTVVNFADERQIVDMRWGFIPHWYSSPTDGPLLINARSETIDEKPAFKGAFERRRCLVPASGFYEWHREKGKGKEPFYISSQCDDLMSFGAVWQAWTSPEGARNITVAMITQAAGPEIAPIHHREPVVIHPKDHAAWLGEEDRQLDMFQSNGEQGYFQSHRVSTEVNGSRSDHAGLMAPLDDEMTNSES